MLRTFVISLPKSTERRENCMQSCKAAGLNPEWFEAVNGREVMTRYEAGDPQLQGKIDLKDKVTLDLGFGRKVTIDEKLSAGELGCALSHLAIYHKMVEEQIELALILEDDCKIEPCFKEILPNLLATQAKWDFLQVVHDSGIRDFFVKRKIYLSKDGAYLNREGMGILDPIFNRRRASFILACYFITLKGAKRLLELGMPVRLPADYLSGLVAYNKLRICTLYPQNKYAHTIDTASTISVANDLRPKHKLR